MAQHDHPYFIIIDDTLNNAACLNEPSKLLDCQHVGGGKYLHYSWQWGTIKRCCFFSCRFLLSFRWSSHPFVGSFVCLVQATLYSRANSAFVNNKQMTFEYSESKKCPVVNLSVRTWCTNEEYNRLASNDLTITISKKRFCCVSTVGKVSTGRDNNNNNNSWFTVYQNHSTVVWYLCPRCKRLFQFTECVERILCHLCLVTRYVCMYRKYVFYLQRQAASWWSLWFSFQRGGTLHCRL